MQYCEKEVLNRNPKQDKRYRAPDQVCYMYPRAESADSVHHKHISATTILHSHLRSLPPIKRTGIPRSRPARPIWQDWSRLLSGALPLNTTTQKTHKLAKLLPLALIGHLLPGSRLPAGARRHTWRRALPCRRRLGYRLRSQGAVIQLRGRRSSGRCFVLASHS